MNAHCCADALHRSSGLKPRELVRCGWIAILAVAGCATSDKHATSAEAMRYPFPVMFVRESLREKVDVDPLYTRTASDGRLQLVARLVNPSPTEAAAFEVRPVFKDRDNVPRPDLQLTSEYWTPVYLAPGESRTFERTAPAHGAAAATLVFRPFGASDVDDLVAPRIGTTTNDAPVATAPPSSGPDRARNGPVAPVPPNRPPAHVSRSGESVTRVWIEADPALNPVE